MIETIEIPNGHHKGRAVPALPTYTFQDSGITVQIRRMSPLTLQRIAEAIIQECKALPEGHEHTYPEPPLNVVDLGGEIRKEPNPADPTYQDAKRAWTQWATNEQNNRFLRLAAARALVVEVDPGVIAEFRADMAREGAALPYHDRYSAEENDRIIYLEHFCIGTTEDMQDFYRFLISRSQPQEAQIQAHIASFRPSEQ